MGSSLTTDRVHLADPSLLYTYQLTAPSSTLLSSSSLLLEWLTASTLVVSVIIVTASSVEIRLLTVSSNSAT